MTLPNRPGYQVADRTTTRPNQNASGHATSPNTVNNTTPPFLGNPYHTGQAPPLSMMSLDHQSSLFGYLPQDQLLPGFGDRMGFLPEGEMPQVVGTEGSQNNSATSQGQFFGPKFSDIFKPTFGAVSENISAEEASDRKNYVRNHRLMPSLMDLLTTCKKENILPEPNVPIDNSPYDDFGLEDFLESQGIDFSNSPTDEPLRTAQREEFLFKLEQLRFKYKEEIEKLNKVCSECCSQMICVLRDQSTIRPVGEHEAQAKLQKIKHKFDYVKNQLRVCVCSAISALQKQYNQIRKKHKSLPKKATSCLTQWFFDHIQNPYPTEQEKAILAATGGLTLTQVNNWFGNKRIRYKRKCLENEGKGSADDSDDESMINQSPPEQQFSSPNPMSLQNAVLPTISVLPGSIMIPNPNMSPNVMDGPLPIRKSTRTRRSIRSSLDTGDDEENDE